MKQFRWPDCFHCSLPQLVIPEIKEEITIYLDFNILTYRAQVRTMNGSISIQKIVKGAKMNK